LECPYFQPAVQRQKSQRSQAARAENDAKDVLALRLNQAMPPKLFSHKPNIDKPSEQKRRVLCGIEN
jgi:hypothetical protein